MHTLSWVAWVGMVMVVALSTTNPFVLGIVLLSVLLVAAVAPRTAVATAGFRAMLILGVGIYAISLAIAVINGNYGSHVLFTIPGPEVPSWLGGLRLGGPVSAEGLLAAGIRGLAILCVFLAFAVFNGALSPHRVLRTTPAALFHAGLVVTVALTLLPASIEDVRRIRELRALRGAPSGVRDLPALVVPAVIGGLERSMRLAEAMEARGYASGPAGGGRGRALGAASAPLLLFGTWAWFYYPGARAWAGAAAVAGLAAIGAWAFMAARSRHTTRLRAEPLAFGDRAGIALSLAAMAAALVGASQGWFGLRYSPFGVLEWPIFSLPGALLGLACAWPALRIVLDVPRPRPASKAAEQPAPKVAQP